MSALPASPEALAAAIRAGNRRAAARVLRLVDDDDPRGAEALRALAGPPLRAHVVGITGNPGSGKSTLISGLVRLVRAAGKTVGVLAVDPSSPFTGGAILGDRIRMQEHATDPGVFIRSLATRGALGGLSRSTAASVRVLDALGVDLVIVETVGVGQDEVDVLGVAHSVAVVVVPGLGDDVQSIKAGILEIADVLVVNKSDRPGADTVVWQLRQMLDLGRATRDGADAPWDPPILKVIAAEGAGLDTLLEAFDTHRAWLESSERWHERRRQRAVLDLEGAVGALLAAPVMRRLAATGALEPLVRALADGRTDPLSAARDALAAPVRS